MIHGSIGLGRSMVFPTKTIDMVEQFENVNGRHKVTQISTSVSNNPGSFMDKDNYSLANLNASKKSLMRTAYHSPRLLEAPTFTNSTNSIVKKLTK